MNIFALQKKVQTLNLRVWYIPLLITSIYFFLFLLIFTPIYETNDDVFLSLIANGFYTKIPTAYSQFNPGLQTIHIIISNLLVFLYTTFPGLNWFSILLFFLSFLSLYALLIPLFQRISSKLLLISTVASLLILFTRILLFLSFTSVVAVATVAGIFLFLFSINQKKYLGYIILSAAILILAELVRQGSFVMILVFAIPFIVKAFIESKSRILLASGVFIMLVSIPIIIYTNMSAYQHKDDWNKQKDFLLTLSTLFYSPNTYNYEKNKAVYSSIGWSKNDYLMFGNYGYEDVNVFTGEKLQTLISTIHAKPITSKAFVISVLNLLFMLLALFEYNLLILLILIVCLPFISLRGKKVVVSSTLIVLAASYYFIYQGYLPGRVTISMIFFVFYGIIFLAEDRQIVQKFSNKIFFVYIVLLATVLVFLMRFYELNSQNIKKVHAVQKILQSLPKGNNLTLVWGSTIPYEWQYVFSSDEEFKDIHFLIGAWTEHSPLNDVIKKRFGITSLYQDLYRKDNVYLVASDLQKKLLVKFLKEHYGVAIKFKVLKRYSEIQYPSQLLKVEKVD